MVPLTKKPLKPTPVYAVRDETIGPKKELQFTERVEHKLGRDVEVVLDNLQPDCDHLPLMGACT